ncbi:MAG TPA: phosphopantetheine-binding protein [Ktedonobacteraceae bacterium]|nr:phosphopantetheine-binding protein [Ktedonobacteraceae bacterium]
MYQTQEIQPVVKDYIGEHIDLEELSEEINIFEAGLVNSLFAIELMTFLERAFCIKIGMDDLDMANFQSISSITAFVQKKGAATL